MDGHRSVDNFDQVTNGSYAQGALNSQFNPLNGMASRDSVAPAIIGQDHPSGLNDVNVFQFSAGMSANTSRPRLHDAPQGFVSPYQSPSVMTDRFRRTQRDCQSYQSPTSYRGSPMDGRHATTSSRGQSEDVYRTPTSSRVQPVNMYQTSNSFRPQPGDIYSNNAPSSSRGQAMDMYNTPTSYRGQAVDDYSTSTPVNVYPSSNSTYRQPGDVYDTRGGASLGQPGNAYSNRASTSSWGSVADVYQTPITYQGKPVDAYNNFASTSSRGQPVSTYSNHTSVSSQVQPVDAYNNFASTSSRGHPVDAYNNSASTSSRDQLVDAYNNSASTSCRGQPTDVYNNSASTSSRDQLADAYNNYAPTPTRGQPIDAYQTQPSVRGHPGNVNQTPISFPHQSVDASFNLDDRDLVYNSNNRGPLKALDNYTLMQAADGSTYYNSRQDGNMTNFSPCAQSVSADSRPSCRYQQPKQETQSISGVEPRLPSQSHLATPSNEDPSGLLPVELETNDNNSTNVFRVDEMNQSAYRTGQQQQQQQLQQASHSSNNGSRRTEHSHNAQSPTFDQNYQENMGQFYSSTSFSYFFGADMKQSTNQVHANMAAATVSNPHQNTHGFANDMSGRSTHPRNTGSISTPSHSMMGPYIGENSTSTMSNSESSDHSDDASNGPSANLAGAVNLVGIFQECTVCKISFMTKAGLRTHMLSHKENKQYECTQCTQSFRHRSTLAHHLLTHTGVRQFQCPICAQSFALKYNMTRHFKKMHK